MPKRPRFTKAPGPTRRSIPEVRLTAQEHQTFCRLIVGDGRTQPGRLQKWAETLEKKLVGRERITGDAYNWLTYRVRRTRPMLFSDAAKIYVAGLRMGDPFFASTELRDKAIADGVWVHSTSKWLQTISRELPDIPQFHYGLSVPGRFEGPSDKPFIPVMLPLEYIDTLSEQLAKLAIARDARGRRPRAGKKIENFFKAKVAGSNAFEVSWNFSASYAVEQIAMRVLYASYFRGHLGEPSKQLDNELTNVGLAISRELQRALTDPKPRAFERVFDRLADDVNKARAEFDEQNPSDSRAEL